MISDNIDYTSVRILGKRFDFDRHAFSSVEELFQYYKMKGRNAFTITTKQATFSEQKYPWDANYSDWYWFDNYESSHNHRSEYTSDLRKILYGPIRLQNMTAKDFHNAKENRNEFMRKANRCSRCNKYIAPWMIVDYGDYASTPKSINPLCPNCIKETTMASRERRLREQLDLPVQRNETRTTRSISA